MLRPYRTHPAQNERQRGCHTVGRVCRLRRALQPEQTRHHRAHLILLRSTGAHDSLFDHGRCILGDFKALLFSRQQDHAARMPQHECGTDILMIEGVLEGEDRWLVTLDELRDGVVQFGESMGKGIAASEAKDPAFDETSQPRSPAPVPRFDHAVARDLSAGVDAQDPHVIPSPPPSPRRRCRSWKRPDRKSTRLNSSHRTISYAVFCLKKKKMTRTPD